MESLNQRHMETLRTGMHSFWEDSELADVEIIVNERCFPCHRALLAAVSPYFRAMFTRDMKESQQKQIEIHDIDDIAFEKFRQFAYTGTLNKTDIDVVEMLKISSLFQVDFLQEHCEKLLIDTVCFKNCLEMYRLSTMYSCEKLEKKCWPAMLDHFSNLCKREEFMELCLEDFIKIISDDKLVKVDEEQVCETAFKWIKADVTKRKQYIYKIFRCIRLPLVSAEYLVTRLYKVPSLTENADCQRLLQEAQSYHMLPARRLDWSSRRMKYRDDDEIEEVLLVITENGEESNAFYENSWCLWAFSLRQCRWFTLAPLPLHFSPGPHFAVCTFGYDLYVSGGSKNPKSMLKFESERNEWTPCAGQLKKGRCNHCMVGIGNSLFCIGGKNMRLPGNMQVLGLIEEYYIPGQRWMSVGELAIPVHSATAAASGENILVFGGASKDGQRIHTVQCFHVRTREATVISHTPLAGNPVYCTKIDDMIFVTLIDENTNLVMKMNSSMGFEDVDFEVPAGGNPLAVIQHYGDMLFVMEHDKGHRQIGSINKVSLRSSVTETLSMKGVLCQKPIHSCRRTFVDKRFLYHTYFQ